MMLLHLLDKIYGEKYMDIVRKSLKLSDATNVDVVKKLEELEKTRPQREYYRKVKQFIQTLKRQNENNQDYIQ
jgi:hypothetical protein